MKDKGLVVTTKNDLAQVEVQCFIESCGSCSARSLCTGQDKPKGLLEAQNPLKASVGDEVEIEIPETKYNQALILLFGTLLVAALLGMGAGYLISPLVPLPSSATSFLGLILAVLGTGLVLFRYFQKKNKMHMYPVIINILKKGDCHG
ncbi:MAG: SoxR reducing system RseC family protein [Candidatus Aminicenantes bacterium]|nr:MAG: SoxR reducing system RseC family protein [Candidatus Aminicenantes bacterium]